MQKQRGNSLNQGLNLVVMIPAYNESSTIKQVISSIPKHIPSIASIKVLVIDDGSRDNTGAVARLAGADYILINKQNLGLAKSFKRGMEKALELGADIIVNTDADNQYNQQEIIKLIQPIIENKADIVSGDRQIKKLDHMPPSKKYGNILGTKVVSRFSNKHIKDASSGFRAYSREAALRLFIMSSHTYTHESLIQASNQNLKIIEIPVEFKRRNNSNSKLISSIFSHIKKSSATIIRSTLMYNSLKVLSYLGIISIFLGIIPMIRWIWLTYIIMDSGMHIQSLLLGLLLIIAGFLSILLGFISDLIAINRRYLEEILYRVKKIENEKNIND